MTDTEQVDPITVEVIRGADLYVLQRFVHKEVLDPAFFETSNRRVKEDDLIRWQGMAEGWVRRCVIR